MSLHWILRRNRRTAKQAKPTPRRATVRPSLERLEDRLTPAGTFTFTGLDPITPTKWEGNRSAQTFCLDGRETRGWLKIISLGDAKTTFSDSGVAVQRF